ncbi:uncharacterized protein LOC133526247 [Cydia pomonella]|uniref:uncharacterized protein LOC133526247 n=1 Tax=Cydia pomonella TaxID=82600 RepID=UPI002ADD7DE0|nr:uncharacterized protein LOC133526247 [Cydia pomonella]
MIMGKKSKNNNKTQESHLPISDEGKLQLENGDFPSETNNSIHSVKKSKKKRRPDLNGSAVKDTPAQIKSEEINGSKADGEIKKKKRGLNDEVLSEEVHNDTDKNLNEDEKHISKKKKKKNKVLEEDVKLEIDEIPEIEDRKPQKGSKKKKNKNSSVNEVKNEEIIVPQLENKETTVKNKKGKNKAKTGAPVLNDEEAQVTEDIDKFIDELDEEDNKQYEDWVKLLDARLSKKIKTE